jgi:hypothetical protein
MFPNLPATWANGSVPTDRPGQPHLQLRTDIRPMPHLWPADSPQLTRERSEIRVGDVERNLVCDQLSAAFAAGRLDAEELDHRLALAVSARTRRQLTFLVHDLGQPAWSSHRPAYASPGPIGPSWQGLDIVAVLLLIGCTVSVLGMLLVIAGVSAGWFFGSVVGGTLAFVAGASACRLMHRAARQVRSDRPDQALPPGQPT